MEELLAQLLQQRALQTKAESDAKHGPLMAQLLRTASRHQAKEPEMADVADSIQDLQFKAKKQIPKSPSLGTSEHPIPSVGDIAGTWDNTVFTPQGLPREPGVAVAHDETAYEKGWADAGGDPFDTKAALKIQREFGYRGKKVDDDFLPEDLIKPGAGYYDDKVMARRKFGNEGIQPVDFEGASVEDAMNMLGQQLRARRIRTLQDFDPEYMAKLPVY